MYLHISQFKSDSSQKDPRVQDQQSDTCDGSARLQGTNMLHSQAAILKHPSMGPMLEAQVCSLQLLSITHRDYKYTHNKAKWLTKIY